MSGTRTIKAEEIKLLADFPIVGPTDGDELVSQSSTFKLGSTPTMINCALTTQNVAANTAANLSVGSITASPFFPSDELPSCYNQFNFPTTVGPSFDTLTFTSGPKNFRGSFIVTLRMSSALAAAPTPEGKFSVLFNIGLLPHTAVAFSRTYQATFVSYNNTLDTYTFQMPFLLPYNPATTSITFQVNLQNRTSSPLTVNTVGSSLNLILQ
jgi:hypothetical protein